MVVFFKREFSYRHIRTFSGHQNELWVEKHCLLDSAESPDSRKECLGAELDCPPE